MLFLARPLFIFGVGFLLFAYALFHSHHIHANLKNTWEEFAQKERVLQEKRNQSLNAEKFHKEIYKPYKKLKKQGVFQPTNSVILKKHLKHLLRSSGVHAPSLQVAFMTEGAPHNYPYHLRIHEVMLEFSARSETPLYQLLKNMEKSLPGLVQVKKFNLGKKGRRKVEGMLEMRVINLL